MKSWTSIADLLTDDQSAKLALLGLPLGTGSVTPGRCDLGPAALRMALPRISTYDLETETELAGLKVYDAGDLDLGTLLPADAFTPIKDIATPICAAHELTIMMGGNNAITRPGVHALDGSLQSVGLLTLDAHFDLRDTSGGISNGNPVQALLDDGMAGNQIAQVGLVPFANAKYMHETAKQAGISVYTMKDCRQRGTLDVIAEALATLSTRCDVIFVDFDIDVIDRAQLPGAPGARPGGMANHDFFAATRLITANPKVRAVDLTEFDPPLDVANISALTAARWFAEVLAGFAAR